MMKYPKINTLFKRGDSGKIIAGQLSRPEFEAIHKWRITEKIDGTNIRVMYCKFADGGPDTVDFGGRTDDAIIPVHLLEHLKNTFTIEKFSGIFQEKTDRPTNFKVILFGEGYGPKIQSGGLYRRDVSFILFDVWINGWWIEPDNVKKLAATLGVDYVPELDFETIVDAITYVMNKPVSKISTTAFAEGVVARSNPLLLFRDGTPLMWKLKVRDFGL